MCSFVGLKGLYPCAVGKQLQYVLKKAGSFLSLFQLGGPVFFLAACIALGSWMPLFMACLQLSLKLCRGSHCLSNLAFDLHHGLEQSHGPDTHSELVKSQEDEVLAPLSVALLSPLTYDGSLLTQKVMRNFREKQQVTSVNLEARGWVETVSVGHSASISPDPQLFCGPSLSQQG